jgi:hypothetical protein
MERVRRETVVDHWLAREGLAEDGATTGDGGQPRTDEAGPLAALLDAKPGAANFLVAGPERDWYRRSVPVADLADWRLVETAPDALWGALSPDGTVGGAARRVADGDAAALAAETGVDVERLRAMARSFGPDAAPALVARTRRGRAPTTVADGNHRAVARVLAAREAGTDPAPQPVYVGVAPNPVVRPVRERLAGLLDRLRGR